MYITAFAQLLRELKTVAGCPDLRRPGVHASAAGLDFSAPPALAYGPPDFGLAPRERIIRRCVTAAMSRASGGVRPSYRKGCDVEQDQTARSSQGAANAATPDSVSRAARVWLSERLHTFWRKAVRTPWRNAGRAIRRAMMATSAGIPVGVDHTTQLAVVPFEGRFPPPLAECTVVEPREYQTRLHPLSRNSATTEACTTSTMSSTLQR